MIYEPDEFEIFRVENPLESKRFSSKSPYADLFHQNSCIEFFMQNAYSGEGIRFYRRLKTSSTCGGFDLKLTTTQMQLMKL